jgi:hypothetical protein
MVNENFLKQISWVQISDKIIVAQIYLFYYWILNYWDTFSQKLESLNFDYYIYNIIFLLTELSFRKQKNERLGACL